MSLWASIPVSGLLGRLLKQQGENCFTTRVCVTTSSADPQLLQEFDDRFASAERMASPDAAIDLSTWIVC
jgi:hypothetical protein